MKRIHDHSQHHNEEIRKNLIQAEAHLQRNPCPECLDKHLIGAEAFMEEEVSTNPNANKELLEMADKIREIRRKIQEMNDVKHGNMVKKLKSTI